MPYEGYFGHNGDLRVNIVGQRKVQQLIKAQQLYDKRKVRPMMLIRVLRFIKSINLTFLSFSAAKT
jgi:hypothetical protein